MIIDTSALVAILQDEPERARLIALIDEADSRSISAATLVETSIVIEARYGDAGVRKLDLFLERAAIEVVPFYADQAREARSAYSRFGKGRHLAGLNFGDCFAYALARLRAEPLLFKGNDFSQTDVAQAS